MGVFTLHTATPHDLTLSIRAAKSFSPDRFKDISVLRAAVRLQDKLVILTLQAGGEAGEVQLAVDSQSHARAAKEIGRWIISADLELQPFYRIAESQASFRPILNKLYGLKPVRPASLFEMLVIAITEQQISMAAAHRIRTRIIAAYGDPINDLWVFPKPDTLAEASISELKACGLSSRKAVYVKNIAQRVESGTLDLAALATMPDEAVRDALLKIKGVGPWSAEYFLVRGLARTDRVPADDLGIRTVVGRYLGSGKRLTATGAVRKLSPFKPFRGLAAFYLLVYDRLQRIDSG